MYGRRIDDQTRSGADTDRTAALGEMAREMRGLAKLVDSVSGAVEQHRAQLGAHGEQLRYLSEHVAGSMNAATFNASAAVFSDSGDAPSPLWFLAGWLYAPMLILAKGLWTMASPFVYTYRSLLIFSALRSDGSKAGDDRDDGMMAGCDGAAGGDGDGLMRDGLHTPYSESEYANGGGGGGGRSALYRDLSQASEAMQLDLGMELLMELQGGE